MKYKKSKCEHNNTNTHWKTLMHNAEEMCCMYTL